MTLLILGHSFAYEMEHLTRMFFPGEPLEVRTDRNGAEGGIRTEMRRNGDGSVDLFVRLERDGRALERTHWLAPGSSDTDAELAMGRDLYRILGEFTGMEPPWGILTGVRPVRLCRALEERMGAERARVVLRNQYLVTPRKADLAFDILERQRPLLDQAGAEEFSLYISVPFCPSRCLYCSFVSHDIAGVRKLIPEYLRLLCEELRQTGEMAARLGLRPRTVYIGGGTPTSLEAGQLEAIMQAVRDSFGLTGLLEYTVEAGRPDTITPEKLETLLRMGADRISINPQTMSDGVLAAIGRNHTAGQTVDAFRMARGAGFARLNADVIAGLPGDTEPGFAASLEQILALCPENITVHTLTVKRSSRLREKGGAGGAHTLTMVERAHTLLGDAGYRPYYLYRQKGSIENLENTGYAYPGMESLYNILIMEEAQTILAAGAGAVTKLVLPGKPVKRVFNYKYPYEYINRFDEMCRRKAAIIEYYQKFC